MMPWSTRAGRRRPGGPAAAIAALAVLGLALGFGTAAAQSRDADFLFERPGLRLGLHGGYTVPRASSEVFDFTREQLTVEREDFRSFTMSGELAFRVDERLDLSLEAGFARSEVPSEFREWVDTDDRPIEQTTTFSRSPVTLSLRGYLRDRGRRVSRFAWVPASWSPFAGVGAGWMWYEFVQEGDFVDVETLDIFTDRFRSSGASPTAHVLAGVDVSLSPRVVLTGQGRYRWASVPMDGRDFEGFDAIDLSGFEATIGLSVRF